MPPLRPLFPVPNRTLAGRHVHALIFAIIPRGRTASGERLHGCPGRLKMGPRLDFDGKHFLAENLR
jgi:hypothetical protein